MRLRSLSNICFLQPVYNKIEQGFDPVTAQHAAEYGEGEWGYGSAVAEFCEKIERRLGGLAGKRVLDLGAGPGQYSIAFAERGADVTWHDPSRNYLNIAQRKAAEHGIECHWSLGYLEDAIRLSVMPFDFVFCRICWFYCVSDSVMTRVVIRLLKPGGAAWLDIPTADYALARGDNKHWFRRLFFPLYRLTGLKFCHFMPERGRVANLLARHRQVRRLDVDYSEPDHEKIWLVKICESL
jgi:SAM-dependent methyltransferase